MLQEDLYNNIECTNAGCRCISFIYVLHRNTYNSKFNNLEAVINHSSINHENTNTNKTWTSTKFLFAKAPEFCMKVGFATLQLHSLCSVL